MSQHGDRVAVSALRHDEAGLINSLKASRGLKALGEKGCVNIADASTHCSHILAASTTARECETLHMRSHILLAHLLRASAACETMHEASM